MKERGREKSWFSTSSERDLARALNIDTLHNLEGQRSSRLPDAMFQHTWIAVQESDRIKREIAIGFDVKNGKVENVFQKEGSALEIDLKSGLSFQSDTMHTLWSALTGQWYGNPYVMLFHTHPRLNEQDLNNAGLDKQTAQRANIDRRVLLSGYNALVGSFSTTDIHVMQKNDRYFRSMLLGTAYGYRWIINPHNTLVKSAQAATSVDTFNQAQHNLELRYAHYASTGTAPTVAWYTRQADQLTREFCQANGYLLFGNPDPYSSLLFNMTKKTTFPYPKNA